MPTDDPKSEEELPWEVACTHEVHGFAHRCAVLRDSNPYDQPALDYMMVSFATELWDQGFSQTEIKMAFEKAINDLRPYAAGEEKRGDRR
jgi:hypothetical protein